MSPEKMLYLQEHGMVVGPEELDFLAEKFGPQSAAAQVKAEIGKQQFDGVEPLVVLDPEDDTLVLMWRRKDAQEADGASDVSPVSQDGGSRRSDAAGERDP